MIKYRGCSAWDARLCSFQCDETRPGCQKCDAYGIPCDYTSSSSGSSPADEAVVVRRNRGGFDSIDTSVASLSIADTVTRVNNALGMGSSARNGYAGTPLTSSSSEIVSLHKFVTLTQKFGYMPNGHRKVLANDVVRLAFSVRDARPALFPRLGF